MGKRQIGDMQPNELVVTLLISEIAAIPLQDANQPVLNGVVAIFMLVIVEIIMSVLTMKYMSLHKILSGKSVVIIKDGKIDQKAMKQVRLTVVDLVELLRGQDVFDISTVSFAVLEVNGELSVLLNKENMPPTISDLNMKAEKEGMQLPIISDGKVISESLDALNITRADLNNLLSEEKIKVKDVFLMTLDRYQNFNIIRKRID
jgi:uncharacterized membrane protein YcaP (DUF421 family)